LPIREIRLPAWSRDFTGLIALATTTLLPIVFYPSLNSPFVTPKVALLRAGGITIVGVAALGLIWRGIRLDALRTRDPRVLLPLAILAWSAITTMASTNPALSVYGLLYVACATAVALGLHRAAGRMRIDRLIGLAAAPALVNVLVLALQSRSIWLIVPLADGLSPRQRYAGLLGNPDYVGSYLVAPALLCFAAALSVRRHRLWYAAAAAAISGGILLTQSIMALVSLITGVLAAVAVHNWRRLLLGLLAVVVVTAGGILAFSPLRARVEMFRSAAAEGDLDRFTSGRTASALAAWEMFRDHPMTGVGVYTYQYQFLPYRLRCDTKYPNLLRFASIGANFGEAHTDHLEILAETGIPGYLLFLSVLVYVGSRSFRPRREDRESNFGRVIGFPLAAAFFVLTLAQFPIAHEAAVTAWIFAAYAAVSVRSEA
jgi:O-antigen ligase